MHDAKVRTRSALRRRFCFPASAATKYFVVVDTVKNCSVIEGNPSAGLTPIGNKDGYDSKDAAKEALKGVRDDAAQCSGVVE